MGQIDTRNMRKGYANHPDMFAEDMAMEESAIKTGQGNCELGEFATPRLAVSHFRDRRNNGR